MKKIRLGIVGCGKMMKNHVEGVQYLDNVEVTAFADVILENAEALASDFKNPYITTDYKTMVDYVDAVLVALPHDLHYECGMFFARHKK
ncbi:MAG: Gfo/Idh/MocA family protein, partial [Clostridia bacterium]